MLYLTGTVWVLLSGRQESISASNQSTLLRSTNKLQGKIELLLFLVNFSSVS